MAYPFELQGMNNWMTGNTAMGQGIGMSMMPNQSMPTQAVSDFTNNAQAMSFSERMGNWWDSSTSEGGWLTGKSMFGGEGQTGWFGPAAQGLGALAQGWTGMRQLDLARENLAFQKEAFNKNYQNQVALTNQAMVDRQTKRSNASSAYSSPDEQWKKENLLPTK